jgi:hypothetical protein
MRDADDAALAEIADVREVDPRHGGPIILSL